MPLNPTSTPRLLTSLWSMASLIPFPLATDWRPATMLTATSSANWYAFCSMQQQLYWLHLTIDTLWGHGSALWSFHPPGVDGQTHRSQLCAATGKSSPQAACTRHLCLHPVMVLWMRTLVRQLTVVVCDWFWDVGAAYSHWGWVSSHAAAVCHALMAKGLVSYLLISMYLHLEFVLFGGICQTFCCYIYVTGCCVAQVWRQEVEDCAARVASGTMHEPTRW